MRIRIHPEAETEFYTSVDFYAEESLTAAERFIQEVEYAMDQISLFPNRWPEIEGNARGKFLKKFPFTIVYRPIADEVHILAIMHQSRKPRYWQDRSIN